MSALINAFSSHPFAQAVRSFAEQSGVTPRESTETVTADDGVDKFTPPVDVFSTPSSYVLHIALPGAKKEDVGVNWDAEKSVLNIAGVIYRAGDEQFLNYLKSGERKVGLFEREVKLGDDGEVDGDSISAKLEDGVLVVVVGKIEKEWTDVKKVDIE
jgi:HSP20 family protein